jgi:hypothetical protein
MRPRSVRPALLLAPILALAAASCGGSGERAGLRAYETAVEDLMAEDGRISSQAAEIRKDLLAQNRSSAEESSFGREQAIPFYRRFGEKAGSLKPADARLAAVHATLREYVAERLRSLESMESFLVARTAPAIVAQEAFEQRWQEARNEVAGRAAGKLDDREVVDALGRAEIFLTRRYVPFLRGQVPRAAIEKDIRGELIPPLERIAARTRAHLEAEGLDGAVARWARAEVEFLGALAASLAPMEVLQRDALATTSAWESAEGLREKFLDGLKAYRESIR